MEEPVSTAISNMREDTREYKAAKVLEDALNDIGWSPVKFAESVTTFHRTLQQTFMRTIVEVIKRYGSEEYGTDLRNRATKALCKDIIATGVLEKSPLPYVQIQNDLTPNPNYIDPFHDTPYRNKRGEVDIRKIVR